MSVLSEDRYLADLQTKDQLQAAFLQRVVDAINNVAKSAGASTFGELTPPPPVNAITVKSSGEQIHATLTHAAGVTRSINYFIEADTSPSFTQPHVMDLGVSRSHIFTLPTLNDSGGLQKWYLRTYAQYPGSKPSPPTVLGGLENPTPIILQGTTKMTILPPTGSGTGSSTGQQGGVGRGKQRVSTPKVIRIGKSQASNAPVVAPVASPAVHLLGAILASGGMTSLSQSGTSTAISVNALAGAGVFKLGDLVITAYPGTVDPGSYGKWYVYHDDPNLQGGNVTYQAAQDITELGAGYGRFPDGTITTTSGGGGSGGGGSGGGGGCVEEGTPTIEPPGTRRLVEPNSDWIALKVGTTEPVNMHPDTLVVVYKKASELMPDDRISVGQNGNWRTDWTARYLKKPSKKVKRICPGGRYWAGEALIELHNLKTL